jgi:SAM-dependent methyltransferase
LTEDDEEDEAGPEGFDPDWLALREPFDALARSERIADALIATLPARPRLLDLGAGTGSLFRWLAPRIGRAQAWTLVDADRAMTEAAFETIADRAEGIGLKVTFPNRRTLLVHAPGGAWRVEALIADLAEAPRAIAAALRDADAVLSSALCDLVTEAWLERMAAGLRVPFYAALCVDGRERFLPPHAADPAIAAGFRRDQSRDKGFGAPALGPRAPEAIARIFGARGFAVASVASDWVADARRGHPGLHPVFRDRGRDFLAHLVLGHAAAAERQRRGARGPNDAWGLARLGQIRDRRLALRIGHRDLLCLPPPQGKRR